MRDESHELNRRNFLEAAAAGGALVAGLSAVPQVLAAEAKRPYLHAYTGKMSCVAGDQLAVHVSTSQSRYSVRITRVGATPRLVWEQENLVGADHPTPPDAAMRGCGWPVAFQVPIASDWRSGVYHVFLQAGDGTSTETFFIVRSAQPGKQSRILFQLSTNTYQAYNGWGGSSLYSGPSFPRVSLDRPFNLAQAVTGPVSGFYNPNDACYRTWDEPFIVWAEQSGYEIDYCANLDLELHPELLEHYRLVLSIGHDEYWSAGMRDNLEAFIARGGNAVFLSGNSVCWQVRVEDAGRSLVCYKRGAKLDPVFATKDHRLLTSLWCDPLIGRPENQLTGVGFPYGGYNGFFGEYVAGPGAGEYIVHRPDHWLFAGTGLQRGESFGRLDSKGPQPGIAGYECDGCELVWRDSLPFPTGRDGTSRNMQVLATAPARWSSVDGSIEWAREVRRALVAPAADVPIPDDYENVPGAAVLGVYERGGTVVTAGSCGWTYGIQARDHLVDRIVRNLLDRLSV